MRFIKVEPKNGNIRSFLEQTEVFDVVSSSDHTEAQESINAFCNDLSKPYQIEYFDPTQSLNPDQVQKLISDAEALMPERHKETAQNRFIRIINQGSDSGTVLGIGIESHSDIGKLIFQSELVANEDYDDDVNL